MSTVGPEDAHSLASRSSCSSRWLCALFPIDPLTPIFQILDFGPRLRQLRRRSPTLVLRRLINGLFVPFSLLQSQCRPDVTL